MNNLSAQDKFTVTQAIINNDNRKLWTNRRIGEITEYVQELTGIHLTTPVVRKIVTDFDVQYKRNNWGPKNEAQQTIPTNTQEELDALRKRVWWCERVINTMIKELEGSGLYEDLLSKTFVRPDEQQ